MRSKIAVAAIIGLAVIGLFYSTLRAQQSESRSVWDGVYTEAQAKRGAEFYGKECAACHGTVLTGGEEAPPLVGGAFLSNWDGLTAGDLLERIRISMPQRKPASVSRQQKADILAHVFRVNEFPAGKTELEHDTERLKQIQFEATKPDRKKE